MNLYVNLSVATLQIMKEREEYARVCRRMWARNLIGQPESFAACDTSMQQLLQFFVLNPGLRKYIGTKVLLFCGADGFGNSKGFGSNSGGFGNDNSNDFDSNSGDFGNSNGFDSNSGGFSNNNSSNSNSSSGHSSITHPKQIQ